MLTSHRTRHWRCLIVGAAVLASSPRAQIAVRVDPADQRQNFEGWGTSLCWWAHDLGVWRQENVNAIATLVADTVTGLGMNIYRYNIGGGDQPGHAHMRSDADVPGYKPTEAGPYDWSADAYQRKTMAALLARTRKPILEAFSNSPPWWMTKSGCASGNTDGSDNLKEDYYDDFAEYLTEVAKHVQDSMGITFRTLAPFNEPNSNWWKAEGRQEGCMFSRAKQPKLILEVGARLKSKGLTGTTVSAADANSIGEMIGNADSYDAATLAHISQFNTHSYYGSDAERRTLQATAKRLGKRLWQSETGPLSWPGGNQFDVAMWSADLILRDLREMRAEAWLDWQVAGGGIWGVIDYNFNAQTSQMNKKGFAYAQFSRFIRPGSIFIGSNHAATVAALVPASGSLVLVAVNTGTTAAQYAFDLSRFESLPQAAQAYRTSSTENVARLPDLAVTSKTITVQAPARSVTTLVLEMAVTTALGPRTGPGGSVESALFRGPVGRTGSMLGFGEPGTAPRDARGRRLP